jgi:hypothetical protein
MHSLTRPTYHFTHVWNPATKVREVNNKLMIRLCSELGLGEEEARLLRERTKIYHSFLPRGYPPLEGVAEGKLGPEWSRDWCLPQPGQMLQGTYL